MKYLLPILLFAVIALAAPAPHNFRLRVLRTGKTGGEQPEYLGLRDNVAVITTKSSEIITGYLNPKPRGMLYAGESKPGYLFPTNEATTYEFRFGGIPKIAGVLYTEFTFIDRTCAVCVPDKILAYAPPKDPGERYLGQFRAYKDGEDWIVKFHTKPPPGDGGEGIDLIREAIQTR